MFLLFSFYFFVFLSVLLDSLLLAVYYNAAVAGILTKHTVLYVPTTNAMAIAFTNAIELSFFMPWLV